MDIFVWKQLLKNLVLPPTGPLLIALVGLVLAVSTRLRGVGLAFAAAGTLSLWALATPIVADALIRAAERFPALDRVHAVEAQAIVILAGGVRLDAPEYDGMPAPSATTLLRLVYGARVAHETGLPVLVSGSRLEAEAMSDVLTRDLSVTPRWVENRSRDTHENAQMSAAILSRAGVSRVVLVTSSAHMARSVVEFEAAGMTVVPAPAEMWSHGERGLLMWEPNASALVRSQRALYEMLGGVVQALRIDLSGSAPPDRDGRPVPSRHESAPINGAHPPAAPVGAA
ncbi:MAG TPA: YdcF family protein [Steroidobacteraceae bacterium]